MNKNYAEICKVDILEADFQQVLLVQFFLNGLLYCCETSIIRIQERQVKYIFWEKISQKMTLL